MTYETDEADFKQVFEHLLIIMLKMLPVPDMAYGPDSNEQQLFTWNTAEHHFEVERTATGEVELFYLNLTTNEMWSYDHKSGDEMAQRITALLRERIS